MPLSPSQQPSSSAVSPLSGKAILITRPKDQSEEVVKLLEQLGATVALFPTIEIMPPRSWEDCDRSIAKIETYDALVITSINAVEKFLSRLEEQRNSGLSILSQKKIYAVGEKTRKALADRKLTVVHQPGVQDAKQMAIAFSKSDVAGKRFLFPKGNLAGDVVSFALREHGAAVDEVIVYETTHPSSADALTINNMLAKKEIDLVTFFSPSSVSNFLAMIPLELIAQQTIAVIGHTTEAAAKNLSLPVHVVAEQSTSAGLVASIVKFYE